MARAGLDPERVTEAAAAIVDSEGVAALTLARLAKELGVASPSLYKHVRGLDDLVARVAASATRRLADQLVRSAVGRSGREALASFAEVYRSFAVDHPGLYPLTLSSPGADEHDREDEAARVLDVLAATLSGYGITGDRAVDGIRLVRAWLHGFVDLERRGGFGMPRSVDTTYAILVDALDASLRDLAEAPDYQG